LSQALKELCVQETTEATEQENVLFEEALQHQQSFFKQLILVQAGSRDSGNNGTSQGKGVNHPCRHYRCGCLCWMKKMTS
jgi:hypothetical protein